MNELGRFVFLLPLYLYAWHLNGMRFPHGIPEYFRVNLSAVALVLRYDLSPSIVVPVGSAYCCPTPLLLRAMSSRSLFTVCWFPLKPVLSSAIVYCVLGEYQKP